MGECCRSGSRSCRQLELLARPGTGFPHIKEDVLDFDFGEDEDFVSNLFVFEDEQEDNMLVTLAQAGQPVASIASLDKDESSMLVSPSPSLDMLVVCKHTAAWLAVP